ncbi:hypothetical protein VTN77DRAFT_19 [Rasamsonia byssochlamydoides]|uniref:uncharacterized protein n=1 Tax=Rasamsonia byssochlamydoides TaxID=89139 RepID=UPI00374426C0
MTLPRTATGSSIAEEKNEVKTGVATVCRQDDEVAATISGKGLPGAALSPKPGPSVTRDRVIAAGSLHRGCLLHPISMSVWLARLQ